jgi:hypothetical protein
MTPLLVHIRPFDVAANSRVDVYTASALEGEAYGLGGIAWAAGLIDRPQLSIEIMSVDLSGRVQVGRARFSVAPANAGIALTRMLKWGGAPVKIYSAKTLAWPAVTEFDGEITDHSFDIDTGLLTITAEPSTSLIEKPLLTLEFDGSGGAGGEAEKRGTLKPAGFGVCQNIPPIFFDTVRNIGMIDGYGNTSAITKLMEGASDMGPSIGNYATYAALAAAIDSDAVPPGRWATCIAEGLVGLGAPPVGVIGVNATFGSDRLGAMMTRILSTHAAVPGGNIDSASFTALDAALNYPVHHWTDQQVECKSLLEQIARSCNSTLLLTFQGKVSVSRAVTSAAVATLDRSGSSIPRCIEWRTLAPFKPVWKMKARAARPAQVLSLDQVNYVDTIIDRGLYNASTVYRAGNLVWLSDKSSWLYTNPVAAAGNAPPVWPTASNAYWQNLTPPLDATDLAYADGTPIEDLRPSDPEATRNAGGQALQDITFLTSFWTFTSLSAQFISALSPNDYGLKIAVDNGFARYTLYGGTRNAYLIVEPGKPMFFRQVVAPTVTEVFPLFDGASGLLEGADRLVEITVTDPADWDLVGIVDWFSETGTFVQRDTIFTADPVDGQQTIEQTLTVPAGAWRARIGYGHPVLTGKTGSWSIWTPWVGEYQPAADVTAAAQVVVELASDKTVAADYLGAVTSGNLAGLVWTPRVTKGGATIKTADITSYAISGTYGGTFAVDNGTGSSSKGNITISAITANTAGGLLTVTVDGVAQPAIAFKVTKDIADPPPPGGGGAKTVSWSSGDMLATNLTSYVVLVTPIKTLTLASGESLYGTANVEFIVSGTDGAIRYMTFKWQYAVAGSGSWNDFGSGVTSAPGISANSGGPPDYEWAEAEPGWLTLSQTAAPSPDDYDIRLVGLVTTSGRLCTVSGSALVEAKV